MDSCPDYHCPSIARYSNSNWRKLAYCSIRIYPLLMSRKQRIDLAIMVGGFCLIGYATNVSMIIWIALGVGAISSALPYIGRKVLAGWLFLSKAIGYLISKVLLTIVFFLALFPVSLIYKLINKNPLDLKDSSAKSLFKDRGHLYKSKDLENPW